MTNLLKSNKNETRLHKYIADCGVTSRRKAEDLITQGRVKVNGKIVRELGTKVHVKNDVVHVDGKAIDRDSVHHLYVLFHKPRCVMTTLNDPEGRPTVIDYMKGIPQRIYPVGRLDYYSEGLLLLTNDGDMANLVMHPSHEITKVYEVKVFGLLTPDLLKKLQQGATIDGVLHRAESVRVIKQLENKTWLEFRLNEGKNREIRKLCEYAGLTVDKLKRVAIAGLSIEGIAPGNFVMLSKIELLKMLGYNKKGECLSQKSIYVSPKKSLKVSSNPRNFKNKTLANHEAFTKFRRENYTKTMALKKQLKQEEEKTQA